MDSYRSSTSKGYARLLAASFRHWTGHDLLPGLSTCSDALLAEALWRAPFGLVSHGTGADPIFRYGNRLALNLFEMTWDEFTAMHSRQSAEPAAGIQGDRNRLMAEALKKGWVADYSGIRVSKSGKRFEIADTILWNVIDESGLLHGQAALIKDVRRL